MIDIDHIFFRWLKKLFQDSYNMWRDEWVSNKLQVVEVIFVVVVVSLVVIVVLIVVVLKVTLVVVSEVQKLKYANIVYRYRRKRLKVNASIFDSALSHTRRSNASGKKKIAWWRCVHFWTISPVDKFRVLACIGYIIFIFLTDKIYLDYQNHFCNRFQNRFLVR